MHEIKCPHCGKVFNVDEAGYAEILSQVRDEAFDKALHERLELAEQEKKTAIELAQAKAAGELKDAVAEGKGRLVGKSIWDAYKKWPVYSKFFDNMGPIPHHMHQSFDDAKLVGQEGKPESYYFPPQYNNCDNNFPYTFMGLEPGTTKADVRKCLENWNRGDNGIIDLAKAAVARAVRAVPARADLPPTGSSTAP